MWRSGEVTAETSYCAEGSSAWRPITELVLRPNFLSRPWFVFRSGVLTVVLIVLCGKILLSRTSIKIKNADVNPDRIYSQTPPAATPESIPFNTPESFRMIEAIPDANGIYNISFILSDKSGRDTACDGTVNMKIKDRSEIFFEKDYVIKKENFKKTISGIVYQLDQDRLLLARRGIGYITLEFNGLGCHFNRDHMFFIRGDSSSASQSPSYSTPPPYTAPSPTVKSHSVAWQDGYEVGRLHYQNNELFPGVIQQQNLRDFKGEEWFDGYTRGFLDAQAGK